MFLLVELARNPSHGTNNMSRKDFQVLAKALKALKPLMRNDLHVQTVETIAKYIGKANPKFDKNNFMEHVYE